MNFDPIDLNGLRTVSLHDRASKVHSVDFAQPPRIGASFAEFLGSLPGVYFGLDLRNVVAALANSYKSKCPIVWGIGAHVIKCGLNPVLISLMRSGIISCIAMNGAGAIHDAEIALSGSTSEDVEPGLQNGNFGVAHEVGDLTVRALSRYPALGLGQCLGKQLIDEAAPFADLSLLATAAKHQIPITVHVAIGTDTIHMLPGVHASRLGDASFTDFRIFAAIIRGLSGGTYVNAGSAVILPEIFLKAVAIVQNIGPKLVDFTTVNIDMSAHYRPTLNVVSRPRCIGGRGFTLTGRHELLIPLLAFALLDIIGSERSIAQLSTGAL